MCVFSRPGHEPSNKYYWEDICYPQQRSEKTTEEIWNKSYPDEQMYIEKFEAVNLEIN